MPHYRHSRPTTSHKNKGLYYLTPGMPREEYKPRGRQAHVRSHGQRKLYFAEMHFLTRFARAGDLVVYAGAAPGIHIGLLIEKFPGLDWILVDPRAFDKRVPKTCDMRQGWFTDEMAAEIVAAAPDRRILFISDIRTAGKWDKVPASFEIKDEADPLGRWIETRVIADMDAQAKWVHIIRPVAASLKVRFPWQVDGKWLTGATGSYFAGDLFIQPCAKPASTEVRLMFGRMDPDEKGDEYPTAVYDYKAIEEQFYHFNNRVRAPLKCDRKVEDDIILTYLLSPWVGMNAADITRKHIQEQIREVVAQMGELVQQRGR
jgi:hypothetical protein